jgi:hypothetical protein
MQAIASFLRSESTWYLGELRCIPDINFLLVWAISSFKKGGASFLKSVFIKYSSKFPVFVKQLSQNFNISAVSLTLLQLCRLDDAIIVVVDYGYSWVSTGSMG